MFVQNEQINRRWLETAFLVNLNPQQILDVTLYYGEDVFAYTSFLDTSPYQGILDEWLAECMKLARTLLEEVLTFDDDVIALFADPKRYFDTSDAQRARDLATKRFVPIIHAKSPDFLKSALIAHIEYGLGFKKQASSRVEFALCEKAQPDFPQFFLSDTPRDREKSKQALIAASSQTAAILVPLIKKYRARAAR